MLRLIRRKGADELAATPEEQHDQEGPEEDEAERIASLVGLDSPRDEAALAEALARASRAGDLGLAAELRRLEETCLSAEEMAERIAEARYQSESYQEFLANHNLQTGRRDPLAKARDSGAYIAKRLSALEMKIADKNLPLRSRERMQQEIDELERAETEFWAVLHPPWIGPFGSGGYENSHGTVPCRQCGRPLESHSVFSEGRNACVPCREAEALRRSINSHIDRL